MSTINLETRRCSRCSKKWVSSGNESLCTSCRYADLHAACPPEIIETIDQLIFDRQVIAVLQAAKDALGIGLGESIEWLAWRHDQLRELAPEKFDDSAEEYWDVFYS